MQSNYTEQGKSKSGFFKIIIFLIIVVAVIAFAVVPTYNKLIGLDEDVNAKWSQVQNQYKRRADLIPNFVETVKGYAAHEKETLEGVINARAKATSINVNEQNIQSLQAFNEAQQGLSSALAKLMVVVEKYPDLKANEGFMNLQNQLEGTENRISVARKDYITVVQNYNKTIRTFPTNIIAKFILKDSNPKPTFQVEEAAQNAPKIEF